MASPRIPSLFHPPWGCGEFVLIFSLGPADLEKEFFPVIDLVQTVLL